MENTVISIDVENKGSRKVYGYLKYNGIDSTKIISSIDNFGSKNPINLAQLFTVNHKIKKIFLLKLEDDFFLIIGHFKDGHLVYNNSFSTILLTLKNYEITDIKETKNQQNHTKTYTAKINYYVDKILDKINEKGYDTLSIEEKKELNYLSRKIN